jgi:hypothetical protein
MSYLTHNGQKVISDSSQYLTYAFNVLGFDGASAVQLSSQPDLSGTKTVNFKVWLDKSTGWVGETFFTLGLGPNNLYMEINSSQRWVFGISGDVNVGSTKTYPLDAIENTLLNCTVVKTANAISSFTINEAAQTSLPGISTRDTTNSVFGASGDFGNLLADGYIWDIEVEGVGSWLGYGGNANQAAAWVDGIGSSNGSILGSPGLKALPIVYP